jgi:tetratricopeptide (TPR) repeat protein
MAQEKMQEYSYWSGVATQFPNIPDILYNAALSSYNAGRRNEALKNLEKALLIDPLFKKAKILQSEILSG